jgi:hypothetical protein
MTILKKPVVRPDILLSDCRIIIKPSGQYCGSGMIYPGSGSDHFLIPDPHILTSWIPDPTCKVKCKHTVLFFSCYWCFHEQSSSLMSKSKSSEIRDTEKIHSQSGSRIQGVKKHWIPDPDPQHCVRVSIPPYIWPSKHPVRTLSKEKIRSWRFQYIMQLFWLIIRYLSFDKMLNNSVYNFSFFLKFNI